MEEIPSVTPHVRRLTVNLDAEDVSQFEGQWAVPHGVALHAYLIRGTRAVVVDPWDAGGYGPEEVEADLSTLGLKWTDIAAVAFTKTPAADLVDRLRAFHPNLEDWGLPVPGAQRDLGNGVLIEERQGFWFMPADLVAFTGDALAGLGWIEEELWAEDLNEHEARWFDDEALRWFCGRPLVPQALPAGCLVVAPAHGCLWGRTPEAALRRAEEFALWGKGAALDEVTVVWPAGAGEVDLDALVGGVLDAGAGLNLFRLPGDDLMAVAAGARRASLIVVSPGLEESFLSGLEKTVWRPQPASAASLRAEVAQRFASVKVRSGQ